MTTIELGDVTSPGFEPAVGHDRRLVRRVALVAVALITLLAVTGSSRPPRSGLIPLWATPMSEADGLLLGADTAYINRTTAGTSRVAAYDLATGAIRWETTVDDSSGDLQVAESAGLVLLAADAYADSAFQRLTVALDARTGSRLWSAPGQATVVSAGAAVMADYNSRGTAYRLRLIRLGDRGEAWARNTPHLYYFSIDNDKIVMTTVDGRVEILRLADGSRLAAGRVRWIPPKPEESQFDEVTATGDHLVVSRSREDHGDVTVYRLDTLAELWHTDFANGYAFLCGPALCVHEGRVLTAFALATGTRLWQWAEVSNPWGAADDRVIVDRGAAGLLMLEASTGRRIGTPVRSGTTVWTVDPGGDVYVLNPTSSPPNRTSVTRWNLTTGRGQLLGTLDLLTGYRCQVRGRYLACNRDHNLEVTAVR
jgi:outer membrane protein assembly factor BamB